MNATFLLFNYLIQYRLMHLLIESTVMIYRVPFFFLTTLADTQPSVLSIFLIPFWKIYSKRRFSVSYFQFRLQWRDVLQLPTLHHSAAVISMPTLGNYPHNNHLHYQLSLIWTHLWVDPLTPKALLALGHMTLDLMWDTYLSPGYQYIFPVKDL